MSIGRVAEGMDGAGSFFPVCAVKFNARRPTLAQSLDWARRTTLPARTSGGARAAARSALSGLTAVAEEARAADQIIQNGQQAQTFAAARIKSPHI